LVGEHRLLTAIEPRSTIDIAAILVVVELVSVAELDGVDLDVVIDKGIGVVGGAVVLLDVGGALVVVDDVVPIAERESHRPRSLLCRRCKPRCRRARQPAVSCVPSA
jgi:hypothetical protein